ASVVGAPFASTAHPGGSASPALARAAILPRATADVARSTITGRGPPGTPAAIGLVDRSGVAVPGAAMTAGPVENTRVSRSCWVLGVAYKPSAPQCEERPTETAARPY